MQTGQAKALHTRTLKAGLDVSDPALLEAWRQLAGGGGSGSNGGGWVLFGYGDGGANAAKCVVPATGSGIAELLSALRDDQVFFGALSARVEAKGPDPARPQLLSFLWVGLAVGPLKRGKAALHQNAVREGAMEGGSMLRGEVSLWDEEREAIVTEEELCARVRTALGIKADTAVVVAT